MNQVYSCPYMLLAHKKIKAGGGGPSNKNYHNQILQLGYRVDNV